MKPTQLIRRFILLILALCFSKNNFAQDYSIEFIPLRDIPGKIFDFKDGYDIVGSPFFPENYTNATVYFKGGGKKENLQTKIYLPNHTILYNLNDSEMVATIVIEKIEFSPKVNGKEKMIFQLFPAVGNDKISQKFYQVIDTGKAKLLKLYTSDFTDNKNFGSVTVIRTYQKLTDLYAYSAAGGIVKINGQESLLSTVFADKQKLVADFINKNDINVKKEKDLKKLFAYYNNL